MPTSPNTLNYRIGRGTVHFKRDGAGAFRHLGNVPSFVYTPEVEKKEHFSSMEGILVKDAEHVTQVGATIAATLEEITPENLAYFALSEVEEMSDGSKVLRGLSLTQIRGTIKVTGTNDVGQKVDFEGLVSFTPTGDFQFISDGDDYSTIELEMDVLKDANGDFGVWTFPPEEPVSE